MKIIDSHAHIVQYIAGTGNEGELRALGDGSGRALYASGSLVQMIPEEFHKDCVTPEDLIGEMDRNEVEKAVLLQGNFYGFQNQYTWDAMQKYPDRLTGAAMYDPYACGKERVRTHLFEELGFDKVKFECSIGSGLMALHGELRMNDEIMDDAIRYAAERGQVIILDIGKCGSPSWQIEAVREEIEKYPDAVFVLCHLLAPSDRDGEVWLPAMERLALPNVWMDTSSLSHNLRPDDYPYPKTIRALAQARDILGADKLLFGTDYPSALKEAPYENYVNFLLESDLFDAAEKQAILHDNAEKVFFHGGTE